MSEGTKAALTAVFGLVIGIVVSTMGIQKLVDRTFDQSVRLGAVEKELDIAENDLSVRIQQVADSEQRLSNLEARIQDLTERASGFKGEQAEARLKLLQEMSEKLGEKTNLDRLFALEGRVESMAVQSCKVMPVTWGGNGSCGPNNDFVPPVNCPTGKLLHGIDIVARKQGGIYQCGFKATCC